MCEREEWRARCIVSPRKGPEDSDSEDDIDTYFDSNMTAVELNNGEDMMHEGEHVGENLVIGDAGEA
jgi:hypothetical protein